jgi:hypothetical protein
MAETTQNESRLAELAYWKGALQQLGVRPIFMQGVDGATGGGVLLLPAEVRDQALVNSMRNVARALGKTATAIEEELKRKAPAPVAGPAPVEDPVTQQGMLKGLME